MELKDMNAADFAKTEARNARYHQMFFAPWDCAVKPFNIVGDVWYVGNSTVSSYMIDTGEGLILFDSGFPHTVALLMQSIIDTGRDPKDVKYIVLTHGHFDHYGACASFQGMYGTKICLGEGDVGRLDVPGVGTIPMDEYYVPLFEPDVVLKDGDVLTLGRASISVRETPGHSPGSITCFMDTEEDGQKYRVCFFGDGSAGNATYRKLKLKGWPLSLRERAIESRERLLSEPADVLLTGHPSNSRVFERQAKRGEGANPFIDAAYWPEFIAENLRQVRELLANDTEEGE